MIETTPPTSGGVSPNPAENPETLIAENEIDKLIHQATESSGDSRSFMEPKTSKKNRGGRPRKDPDNPKWNKAAETAPPEAEIPPPPPTFQSAKACKMVFAVVSGLIVKTTQVQDTALSVQEIDALGDAWGAVVDAYLPSFLQQHGDLLTAITVTGGVAMRIHMSIQKEVDRQRAEMAKTVQSETVQ